MPDIKYTWTQEEVQDPNFFLSLQEQAAELDGLVKIQLADGTITCGIRVAYFNLICWTILRAFRVPICKRHFLKRTVINKGVLAGFLTGYLEELVHNQKERNIFRQALFDINQYLYTFCSTRLLDYVETIDILDMATVMADERISKIRQEVQDGTPDLGTPYIEKLADRKSKELMKLLGDVTDIGGVSCLSTYQRLGYLNKFQVPQTMNSAHLRTDINDRIISKPVVGNFVEGMHDITDFAIEHTSAKKSQVYNKVGVSKSQYFGRKMHLVCSTLHRLYQGDCGSTATVKFNVTERNYTSLDGATIFVDGQPVVLTSKTAKDYIGTTVHKRSPMTCRHTDGVCVACGGKLLQNVYPTINIGMLTAIQVIEPITQKILSSKHLIKTDTLVFDVHESLEHILKYNGTSNLHWDSEVRNKLAGTYLGVDAAEFIGADRIMNVKPNADKIKASSYSRLRHFYLRKNDKVSRHVLIEDGSKFDPLFFSGEMLVYIRSHIDTCVTDDDTGIFWIPLDNAAELPVFSMTVLNDNMLQYVSACDSFLRTKDGLSGETSCSNALQRFSDLVHSKVELNLTHMEILLKAYMVTSPADYRIPQVDDPENTLFSSYEDILHNRACGTTLAFENIMAYLTNPLTYLQPKQSGVFDNFTVNLANKLDR